MLVHRDLRSPVGPLRVIASSEVIKAVLWGAEDFKRCRLSSRSCEDSHALLDRAVCQLNEYFSGRRRSFDLPLEAEGTDFQRRVWQALSEIPLGETRTYGQIAERIGAPKGARAVGLANRSNPISIIVPCHRVIGADGRLTGFAGGLDSKRALLELERRTAQSADR